MTSAAFRLGLIGAGRMGGPISGARPPRWSRNHGHRRVVRSIRASARGFSADLFASVDELLATDEIDGALVAAPSDRHVEIVTKLAGSRVPVLLRSPAVSTATTSARPIDCRSTEFHFRSGTGGATCRLRPHSERGIAGGRLGDLHLMIARATSGTKARRPRPSGAASSSASAIPRVRPDPLAQRSGDRHRRCDRLAAPLGRRCDERPRQRPGTGRAFRRRKRRFVSLGRHYPVPATWFESKPSGRGTPCGATSSIPAEATRRNSTLRLPERKALPSSRQVALRPASVTDAIAALEAVERASAALGNKASAGTPH